MESSRQITPVIIHPHNFGTSRSFACQVVRDGGTDIVKSDFEGRAGFYHLAWISRQ
jgi:hypothetical protein